MAQNYISNIVLENARLMFKNFSGRETDYNMKGNRNFHVVIPNKEMAEELANEGWNIGILAPREPGEEPVHHLKVNAKYGDFPPKIFMVVGDRDPVLLTADSVGELDNVNIKFVDITITPYRYTVRGNTGVSAYVKEMYAVIDESPFAAKYSRRRPDIDEGVPFM